MLLYAADGDAKFERVDGSAGWPWNASDSRRGRRNSRRWHCVRLRMRRLLPQRLFARSVRVDLNATVAWPHGCRGFRSSTSSPASPVLRTTQWVSCSTTRLLDLGGVVERQHDELGAVPAHGLVLGR